MCHSASIAMQNATDARERKYLFPVGLAGNGFKVVFLKMSRRLPA